MPSTIGTTNGFNFMVASSNPSTAESTEMAGVMTPSPYRSAAPATPRTLNQNAHLVRRPAGSAARESRVRMPR
jgi:hypothetical protein